MNSAQALHSAARRYCVDHFRHWCEKYSHLPNSGRVSDGYHYSEKALTIFPRFNVLTAIQTSVERIDSDLLADFGETKQLIVSAGSIAGDAFTQDPGSVIAYEAQEDEREKFCDFTQRFTEVEALTSDPMPYQRVLSDDEASEIWAKLGAKWGISAKSLWVPLIPCVRSDVVAFDFDTFRHSVPTHAIIRAVQSLDIRRIWMMREFGPSYSQSVELFDPCYNGAEGFWTAVNFEWVVYASHESTITVAGILLEKIKSGWPNWKNSKIR